MRPSLSRSSSLESSASSLGRRTSTSSWSSDGAYDLLEPVEGTLPHEIVEVARKEPSRRHENHQHSSSKLPCTLHAESTTSIFSFPRNHTSHARCPRHGIVHDPALSLPERDSRSLSSVSSTSSTASTRSGESACSKRSLKCTLKRAISFKRP
ncbi:hypothetical protein JCM10449v2_005297 [Rhodotorula kratochvilovae]